MSHAALTLLLAYLAGVAVMTGFWPRARRHPRVQHLFDQVDPAYMALAALILTLTWPVSIPFAIGRNLANRSK